MPTITNGFDKPEARSVKMRCACSKRSDQQRDRHWFTNSVSQQIGSRVRVMSDRRSEQIHCFKAWGVWRLWIKHYDPIISESVGFANDGELYFTVASTATDDVCAMSTCSSSACHHCSVS